MATEYKALPGGDGGAWVPGDTPPRHLAPVAAQSTAGEPIRKKPVKTRRVDLEGDYEGWWFVVRTNAPIKSLAIFGHFDQNDPAKVVGIMAELIDAMPNFITDWNFVDEEGADLPCDPSGFATLDSEQVMAIMGGIGSALSGESAVPKG